MYHWMLVLLLSTASLAQAQQLAFPSAEGFGRFSKGGRGGKAYNINSLSWSAGSGGSCNAGGCLGGTITLHDCLTDRFGVGPRTCIFKVGGYIDMGQNTYIGMKSGFTIAGQTAPGDGIVMKNGNFTICAGFDCGTPITDVIIRHLRIANGQNGGFAGQDSVVYNGHEVIFDHCSFRWASDDTIGGIMNAFNVTWQWSIITEGLSDAPSNPGQHGKIGGWSYTPPTASYSFLHNLFANSGYRAPSLVSGQGQVINNLIYNILVYGSQVVPQTAGTGGSRVLADFIGNYYRTGPNTVAQGSFWPNGLTLAGCGEASTDCTFVQNSRVYVQDNYHNYFRPTGSEPQEAFIGRSAGVTPILPTQGTPTLTTANYTRTTPLQARTDVLARAGAYAVASGMARVRRDSVDSRAVNDVNTLTGRIIRTENDVGGYPPVASGTPYTDTDGDGIADSWETAHGLNPHDPADGPRLSANGYTNLENFLNELAGDGAASKARLPRPMGLKATVAPTP